MEEGDWGEEGEIEGYWVGRGVGVFDRCVG